jgi:hypothetical protein
MPQIYSMGPTALFPCEGRRAEDFVALKNPKASAGMEPTNLGTKGQHATSRPPKLLGLEKQYSNYVVSWTVSRESVLWAGQLVQRLWFGLDSQYRD